jgi:hypothetical protein
MWRRTTRTTDAKRPGKYAIHRGVGGQGRTTGLELLAELGFEMAGDGDHDRRRRTVHQVIDELELLRWSQRRLEDDDLVLFPCTAPGVNGTDILYRDTKPAGCRPDALGEHQIVLDHKERSGHARRIAGRSGDPTFWPSPKASWRLL